MNRVKTAIIVALLAAPATAAMAGAPGAPAPLSFNASAIGSGLHYQAVSMPSTGAGLTAVPTKVRVGQRTTGRTANFFGSGGNGLSTGGVLAISAVSLGFGIALGDIIWNSGNNNPPVSPM